MLVVETPALLRAFLACQRDKWAKECGSQPRDLAPWQKILFALVKFRARACSRSPAGRDHTAPAATGPPRTPAHPAGRSRLQAGRSAASREPGPGSADGAGPAVRPTAAGPPAVAGAARRPSSAAPCMRRPRNSGPSGCATLLAHTPRTRPCRLSARNACRSQTTNSGRKMRSPEKPARPQCAIIRKSGLAA